MTTQKSTKFYQLIERLFPEKSRWRLHTFLLLGKYFDNNRAPISSYRFRNHAINKITDRELSELVANVKKISITSLHDFFEELRLSGLCKGDEFDPGNKKLILSQRGRKCYAMLITPLDD